MAKLLRVDASPRGDRSHSQSLTKKFIETWLTNHPEDQVTTRDLGQEPVPPVDEAWIGAAFTPNEQRSPEQHQKLALSDGLIDELLASDILVLGVPMYNFGVPAALKAWIDQMVRVGRTFAVKPKVQGLATGKKAYIMMSAGFEYGAGAPFASYNFVEPYLRAILGFIGIEDVSFAAVATNSGDQVLENTRKSAEAVIARAATA